ncbi:MAG: ATP-binding cassette domain-containing protein [Actinobacteria bacterium]|nr:ATP-binding cassette domain-containing protein [Actinomycetota bacterium]
MSSAKIEFRDLSKHYKDVLAVSNFSAQVQSGRVTGFLGPNGAGKSTALRCLLGLVTPTNGSALINGGGYSQLEDPIRKVGAVLDSRGFHPGLTAKQNLKVMASATDINFSRIDEVLELVDLAGTASKRTKGFSLGMKQRLSLAIAMLGDPEILILDEPANGLDPLGIVWLREFLQKLAGEGRTILVSSHQLAEMQNTVNDVLIINKGVLVARGSIKEICQGGSLEEAFLELTFKK